MRRWALRAGVPLAVLLGPWGVGAETGRLQANVVYVTMAEVYIDAGTQSGISPGDPGVIQRQGKTLARAEVMDAGRSSARLRLLSKSTEEIQAGDTVTVETSFRTQGGSSAPAGVKPDPDFVPLLAPWPGPRPSAFPQRNIFHGSLRMRDVVQDDSSDRSDYSISRMELTSDMDRLAGSSWSLRMDGNVSYRSGVAFENSADYREARYDVFRLLLEGPVGGRGFARMGRFAPAELPAFGFIDGVQGEARLNPGFRLGAVGGFRPEGTEQRPSSDWPSAGLYASLKTGGSSGFRTWGTVGVLADYFKGDLDRLALLWEERVDFRAPVSFLISAEGDKRVDNSPDQPSAQLSRLNVSASWYPWKSCSLRGGVDSGQSDIVRPSQSVENNGWTVSGADYFRSWVALGQSLGWGWRAEGDVSFYHASSDDMPPLWRGGLTKTRLPFFPSGYLTGTIYNISGRALEGLGAQASMGLPMFRQRLYLGPTCRARNAVRPDDPKKWEWVDYGARADWRVSPFNIFAGFVRTNTETTSSVLMDLGVDYRW
ncbi:MAG: hypothetical protein IPP35_07770 [Elusimicrobia bacterium]|nr:hypothetical protein [Elusimicrobiota bacterium]